VLHPLASFVEVYFSFHVVFSLLHLSVKAFVSLQVPPTKAAAVSLVHERNNGVAGVPVDKGQEKPLVCEQLLPLVYSVVHVRWFARHFCSLCEMMLLVDCNYLIAQISFLIQVDLSVLSPVGSGLSEKYKVEKQEQQDREETQREMKREQRSEDREGTDLSKPPPQRASKGVKPESRLPKSEKACELLQTQTGNSFLVWFQV
jgi:hypothetical protein